MIIVSLTAPCAKRGNMLHISGVSGRANIVVAALNGQILRNETAENGLGNISILINYPAGIYVIRVATAEEIKTAKVVVL